MTATEQAVEFMEEFRTYMRNIGQATPRVEQFIDEMSALIALGVGPKTALDALFDALAVMDAKQTEVSA